MVMLDSDCDGGDEVVCREASDDFMSRHVQAINALVHPSNIVAFVHLSILDCLPVENPDKCLQAAAQSAAQGVLNQSATVHHSATMQLPVG